jgi:hypothetical protein
MSEIQRYVNEDLCINVSANALAHILAREPNFKSCGTKRRVERFWSRSEDAKDGI